MGLFDMVMIKDNHISAAGGVTGALKAVDLYLKQNSLQMEVEVVFSLIVSLISFPFPFIGLFVLISTLKVHGICFACQVPTDIISVVVMCYRII